MARVPSRRESVARVKTLLVVWHTRTGGTAQMVRALERGASVEAQVRVVVKHAPETVAEDVLTADGVVFATPENLASMAGVTKDFFDRTYYDLIERTNGKPYAVMICAGSDGTGAARQIERIATGLRLRCVAETLIVNTQAQTRERILAPKAIGPQDLRRCEELGGLLATGLAMGVF